MTKQAFTTQPRGSWHYRHCTAPSHRYMGKESVPGWVESLCNDYYVEAATLTEAQQQQQQQQVPELVCLPTPSMWPTWCCGWRGSLPAVKTRSCLCSTLCSSWTETWTCSPRWPRSSPTRVSSTRSMGSITVRRDLFDSWLCMKVDTPFS